MAGVLFGLALFLSYFCLHVITWRMSSQPTSMRRLAGFSIKFFLIFCLILPALVFDPSLGLSSLNRTEFLHGILLFLSLNATYIIFYPGIEFDSPSNKILLALFFAGKNGTTENHVRSLISNENSTQIRLEELIESGKLTCQKDKLSLSASGRRLYRFFNLISGIFRIDIR